MNKPARFPKVFLIGAPKCGTTSLVEALKSDHRFFFSSVKEPQFFCHEELLWHSKYLSPVATSAAKYQALYSKLTKGQIAWDASTSYLWCSKTPARIRDLIGEDVRVIVSLRDPVERAWSHYLNDVREGIERRSFSEALSSEMRNADAGVQLGSLYLAQSLYASGLQRYIDVFGRERMLVLLFDDLIDRFALCRDRIYYFIDAMAPLGESSVVLPSKNRARTPRTNVASLLLGSAAVRQFSRTLVPRKLRSFARSALFSKEVLRQEMPLGDRNFLSEYFAADQDHVEAILGISLPWRGSVDTGWIADTPSFGS